MPLLFVFLLLGLNVLANASSDGLKDKKKKLDEILYNAALENLVAEEGRIQNRQNNVSLQDSQTKEREQTIARLAGAIQTNTAKIFRNSPLIDDLKLRKEKAKEILKAVSNELFAMQIEFKEIKETEQKRRKEAAKKSSSSCFSCSSGEDN